MTKLILIVEDEENQRQILKYALNKVGFAVEEATSGYEALQILSGDEANRFDLVLLDMVIGDVNGKDILHHVRDNLPNIPVIVLTGHSSVDNAVEAMRNGAADFISKPVEVDRLKISIENALRVNKLSGEISRLSRKWSGLLGFDDLVGSSAVMEQAVSLAKKAAHANIPILLEGESGVGKEVFARAIQGESDRSGKAFVVVNCGAIPHNLVESILFGHEKGAFTGANEKHVGKFLEADGGTIFLDEIGELPLDLQVKLLRVLQENEVDPIGATEPIKVDVRLISATNRHLQDMVDSGEFREDLFYRLNIFPIKLPPLRARREDIEYLVPHFLENISISEDIPPKEISSEAMELLKSYNWPGNIRQLENSLFRAAILSDGDVITSVDFPHICPIEYRVIRHQSSDTITEADSFHKQNGDIAAVVQKEKISALDENGDIRPIMEVEREMIEYALREYEGRITEVARRLGLGRSTLYRKIAALELDEEMS